MKRWGKRWVYSYVTLIHFTFIAAFEARAFTIIKVVLMPFFSQLFLLHWSSSFFTIEWHTKPPRRRKKEEEGAEISHHFLSSLSRKKWQITAKKILNCHSFLSLRKFFMSLLFFPPLLLWWKETLHHNAVALCVNYF